MSNKQSSILSAAIEEALNSDYCEARYRISCIAVKDGCIVSKGKNHLRTKLGKSIMPSFHAEVDTINRVRKTTNKKKIDLYVTRVDWNGNYANARPCMFCTSFIKYHGIRKVYYTLNDSEVVVIKAKDMDTSYLTYSQKNHIDNGRCFATFHG